MEHALPGAAARQPPSRASTCERRCDSGAGTPSIMLFVCQGNICRSPFAEALLRARLGDRAIAIGSAGMMPQPGRPTPIFGLEAAAAHGIDLSAHRSIWLTRQMA